MNVKQDPIQQELVSLSVRVSKQTADLLKEVADAHYRPVAAEMRRLIEERVEAYVIERDAKAAA